MRVWLFGVLALWVCTAEAKTKVVATVADLGAIAREVGGDTVDVEVLARPTQDPHFVDPKPSLVLTLSRAQLLVLVGMELETGWLPTLLVGSRNAKLQQGAEGYFDASTVVAPLEVPKTKIDRSMGDIHPGGNPHYTKDPRNALRIAEALAERLKKIDPSTAAKVDQNLAAFRDALNARVTQWQAALKPFAGKPVVTFHKSWVYFTAFAGLVELAYVEPKPGIPPDPQHVVRVLGAMRSNKVPLILQEEWYSDKVTETLAAKANAKLVRVPGQTPDGKRYLDHVDGIVQAVVSALGSTK